MSVSLHRDRFTWLLYLMLAFYAYLLNIFGPITPFLKSELGLSYTVSSLHFTAFAAGILLVGFAGHRLIERVGRWYALWLGAAGMSLSAFILLLGRHAPVTISAAFLMGLIGSLILAVVPAALSERHRNLTPVAISEANVIASLVSMAAPLLVGFFALSTGGWRWAVGMVAAVPVFLYLALGHSRTPISSSSSTSPPEKRLYEETQASKRSILPILFWFYWFALFLAVSIEFCMVFWSAGFLETALALPTAYAAQSVGLFLGAMVLGRIAGSRLVARFPAYSVISGSSLIAVLGFLGFWQAGTALTSLAGLFLIGLGTANLYPLILALAIEAAPGKDQGSSRAALASGSAILTLPLILGRLADGVGIRAAFGVVLLLLLGVFLIVWLSQRIS